MSGVEHPVSTILSSSTLIVTPINVYRRWRSGGNVAAATGRFLPPTVPGGRLPLMGVFGMLGIALMVFVLRESIQEALWSSISRLIAIAFWGLNIGLALMILLSLLPGGLLQLHAVIENGYWYARDLAFTGAPLPRLLEWLRMPGDLIFMFAGVLPLVMAMTWGYASLWRRPAPQT